MVEERRPDLRDRVEAAAFGALLAGLRALGRDRAYRAGEALGSFAARAVPLRRAAAPEEIASCCLFLASDESSFVSGTTLVVDGGGRAVELASAEFGLGDMPPDAAAPM